jgi:hypothetical protein
VVLEQLEDDLSCVMLHLVGPSFPLTPHAVRRFDGGAHSGFRLSESARIVFAHPSK